jgi:hypothetical protein
MRRRLRKHRLLATIVVAAIAVTGAYAYTNTVGGVSPPLLGYGTGSIDKYSLSNLSYNLNNSGNSNQITSISFTLDRANMTTIARVKLSAYVTWYSCSSAAAPAITCATTSPQVLAVTSWNGGAGTLTIVATG